MGRTACQQLQPADPSGRFADVTANKVIRKKARPEYRETEKKWIAGDYKAVAVEQDRVYTEFLGLKHGFTDDSE